ncbi:MAG: hypothetical protein F4Z01_07780 [Gammaproteobacteria bacterium]|nr:hypothetical protein [Gammaproteobacteria bacterium]MYF39227.1 hypothetical protein [Gammaproteobacteria bacterium]
MSRSGESTPYLRSRKKLILRVVLATVAFLAILAVVYGPMSIVLLGYWIIGLVLAVPMFLSMLILGLKAPQLLTVSSVFVWCILLYVCLPFAIVAIVRRLRRKSL